MNIDELNSQLLSLKAKQETKAKTHEACYKNLRRYILSILEKNINQAEVKIAHCTDSSAQLVVAGSYSIDLHFSRPWGENAKDGMKLELNFGCFGSFDKSNTKAVKFCKALGQVAEKMDVIEQQLFKADAAKSLWKDFFAARRESYAVGDEIHKIEGELKSYEANVRREKIMKNIVVGRQIMVSKPTTYHPAQYKTIESVTPKNIVFKEDWGRRTKKEDVISNLMCNRWVM